MDINSVSPPRFENRKNICKIDMQLVNQLLNDIILYNDIKDNLPVEPIWKKDQVLFKSLENDARVLLEKVLCSENNEKIKVAVVGNFSAGKSTFINSLIQDHICPVSDKSTTSSVTTFNFAENKAFHIIDDFGNKKDISVEDYKMMVQHGTKKKSKQETQFLVEGPWNFLSGISLLDTPGFQRGEDSFDIDERRDDAVTEEIIKNDADIIFWLIDINTGTITKDQKERIIRLKSETKKSVEIYIILNKAETKTEIGRQNILDGIKKDMGQLVKDVVLFSSIDKNDGQITLSQVISRVESSINCQSLLNQEQWELKFTSSIGRRGRLKFHFHENDNKLNFLHSVDQGDKIGKILERFELKDMLKQIETDNSKMFINSLNNELTSYRKRKENLRHVSNKIKKQIDTLWESDVEKTLRLYDEVEKIISEHFVYNTIGEFGLMNLKTDYQKISDSFMELYSSAFNLFRLRVGEKFNYSIYEKELDFFDLRESLKNYLIATEDIEKAILHVTSSFCLNLYSAFYAHIEVRYQHKYEKYNNIYTKLL